MPCVWGMSAPWRTLASGITSSSRPPMAVQSRRVSSSSLSDWLSQSARSRPRSSWSRTMAATCLPLPQPVPSPSIQPRRKRTGVRQRLIVARAIVAAVRMCMTSVTIVIAVIAAVALAVDAVDGLPSGPDAVERGEMALVGLAGEDDALKLGIGQEPLGHDPGGQHRTVRGRRVRHRRHGAGLHQRRGMLDRAGETDGARPPGFVRAGGVRVIGGFSQRPGQLRIRARRLGPQS